MAERFEKPIEPFAGNSRTTVFDYEMDLSLIARQATRRNRHQDFTFLCELYAIIHQVDQNLTGLIVVTYNPLRRFGVHPVTEVEAFLGCDRRQQVQNTFNTGTQIEGFVFDFNLPAFHL